MDRNRGLDRNFVVARGLPGNVARHHDILGIPNDLTAADPGNDCGLRVRMHSSSGAAKFDFSVTDVCVVQKRSSARMFIRYFISSCRPYG